MTAYGKLFRRETDLRFKKLLNYFYANKTIIK